MNTKYRLTPPIGTLVLARLSFAGPATAAEFECVIQPRQVLEIRSPIDGLLRRVAVDRGQKVVKGQEIAFLDTAVEQVALESARFRSRMEAPARAAEPLRNAGPTPRPAAAVAPPRK